MHYAKALSYQMQDITTKKKAFIKVTPDHLFYSKKNQKYIPIDFIKDSDILITFNGKTARIICPKNKHDHCGYKLATDKIQPVYNLEIQGLHNYFAGNIPILVHNGCYDRYYVCGHCSKAHKEKKMFSSFCDKSPHFQHVVYLMHQCDYCGQDFTGKSSRTAHIERCHTNKKKYVCQFCDGNFTHLFNKIKHINVHERLKFKIFCNECDEYIPLQEKRMMHNHNADNSISIITPEPFAVSYQYFESYEHIISSIDVPTADKAPNFTSRFTDNKQEEFTEILDIIGDLSD